MNIESLDQKTILSEETFEEVIEETDLVLRERMIMELSDKSKLLGVKTKFDSMLKAYLKQEKLAKKAAECDHKQVSNNTTDFDIDDTDYRNLSCGNWIADEQGVRMYVNIGNFPVEKLACSHPILPVMILENAETGKEKMKIAFRKGFFWKELTVDKNVLYSANRIVSLSDYGVIVTSETSKALVSYISDIESCNQFQLERQISTGKLGWIRGEFMPYGKSVIFDNEDKFKNAYEAVTQKGDRDEWYDLVTEIRSGTRIEPKIYIAGALASVLLEPLNALPFIVNLWGDTGKGKTVAIMLAASVWANPDGNEYVTDPKSTPTALELRLDFLNNMPMLIDDLAQLKEKYNGDFSELVYLLCSGRGKDRANASLGLNKPTNWKNVILTNGEHSMVTETMQGGAVNRIIDVEMAEGYIFPDGNKVVETVKKNYGFCGKEFIDLIQDIGLDKIREVQQSFLTRIKEKAKSQGVEKEEKQSLPMSIILTADKLATDYLFKDGMYLDFDTCVDLLKNKGEVSENERALDYIKETIAANIPKFNYATDYQGEVWGEYDGTSDYIYVINNRFTKLCNEAGSQSKSFLTWATKHGHVMKDGKGKSTIVKKINGAPVRCVKLKIKDIPLAETIDEPIPF